MLVRDVEKVERRRGQVSGEERGRSGETDSTVRQTTDLMMEDQIVLIREHE